MTETTNYKLKKPESTDTVDISVLNGNADTLDSELDKLSGALALIQRGDEATENIEEGQYVLWKGVLKKATAAITEGETLSDSNLSTVSGGLANNSGLSGITIINKQFIGGPSSTDPTYGLPLYSDAFTTKGKALVFASVAIPSYQNTYMGRLRIDIVTENNSIYQAGVTEVGDNISGTVHRSVAHTFIINEAGTYKVCARFIPQTGATVNLPAYNNPTMTGFVIPLN